MDSSTKSRDPSSPLHSLLDHLRDLQKRTTGLGGNPEAMNVVEAYSYFVSQRGRNCPMALKSLKLFLSEDYQDVRRLIEQLSEDLKHLSE